MDSGVKRRIKAHTHKSEFTLDKTQVNPSKNMYLTDTELIKNFEINEELLNAWFFVLAEYSHNWITKKQIYLPTQNFIDTKNEIIEENDIIKEYIDRRLVLTIDNNDRLPCEEVYNDFKALYPKSLITDAQFKTSIKDKGITYDRNLRCNGFKGIFKDIKFKVFKCENDGELVEEKLIYSQKYVDKLLNKIKELENELALKNVVVETEEDEEEEYEEVEVEEEVEYEEIEVEEEVEYEEIEVEEEVEYEEIEVEVEVDDVEEEEELEYEEVEVEEEEENETDDEDELMDKFIARFDEKCNT
jgi:hypothetical protein